MNLGNVTGKILIQYTHDWILNHKFSFYLCPSNKVQRLSSIYNLFLVSDYLPDILVFPAPPYPPVVQWQPSYHRILNPVSGAPLFTATLNHCIILAARFSVVWFKLLVQTCLLFWFSLFDFDYFFHYQVCHPCLMELISLFSGARVTLVSLL